MRVNKNGLSRITTLPPLRHDEDVQYVGGKPGNIDRAIARHMCSIISSGTPKRTLTALRISSGKHRCQTIYRDSEARYRQ